MTDAPARARRHATIFLLVAGAILWIPTARLLLGRPPGFLRDLGFASGPPGTPLAWLLGLAVAVAYILFTLRQPLVRAHWLRPTPLKLLAILVAVAAAIVEEAFFRRLVMDAVQNSGGGSALQVLASAFVFGAAHGVWGIATRRLVVGVAVAIVTGLLGAALAVVYLVGGRSLAPVIVSHFLITASIQPGITFAAFAGRMRLP